MIKAVSKDLLTEEIVRNSKAPVQEQVICERIDDDSEREEDVFKDAETFDLVEPQLSNDSDIYAEVNRAQIQVPESMNRLGESVYKLNHYVAMKKDIKALQKENCVRDDIKKKLDLKERWLSTPSPVESLSNKFSFNSRTMSRDSIASGFSNRSIESTLPVLDAAVPTSDREEDHKRMKDNFDKILIEDQDTKWRKPALARSDSLEDLLREKALKQKRLQQPIKNLETISFSNTMDFMKSKITAPKVKAQDSFDMSKYFPDKKTDKKVTGDVNKSQKTLKEVDLSQYFAANMAKDNIASDKPPTAKPPKLEISLELEPPPSISNVASSNLKQEDFNMFDQLMDGAIDLKKFMDHFNTDTTQTWSDSQPEPEYSIDSLMVNNELVKSPSQEYKHFFENVDEDNDDVSISLDDLVDDNIASDFESIVTTSVHSPVISATLSPSPPKQAPPTKPVRLSLQKKKDDGVKTSKQLSHHPQKPKRTKSFSKPVDPNRGIDSNLVPPRPRTIRSIPGMILNTVKGKKAKNKQEKVAVKESPKKLLNAKKLNIVVPEKRKSEEKDSAAVLNDVKIKKEYVPDPKMSKFFFDDVSILDDIGRGTSGSAKSNVELKIAQTEAGNEIFDQALETSSIKRNSDIDRVFEKINSQDVEEDNNITVVDKKERNGISIRKENEDLETIVSPISTQSGNESKGVIDRNDESVSKLESRKQEDELHKANDLNSVKKEKLHLTQDVISPPVDSNCDPESSVTEDRKDILLKMHEAKPISGTERDWCPPTPTPRRRSKSRSEPRSPEPPRRTKRPNHTLNNGDSHYPIDKDTKPSDSSADRLIERIRHVTPEPMKPYVEKCDETHNIVPRKTVEPEKQYTSKYDTEYVRYKRRSADLSETSPSSTISRYDNLAPSAYRQPTTSYLLAQSRNLHDRKREFMNDRVAGNNPYMKRVLSREEREDRINTARSALNESRQYYSPTSSIRSPTLVSSALGPSYSSMYGASRLNDYYSPPAASGTSSALPNAATHSFIDYFKRSPQSPTRREARDGCIIC